MISNHCFDDRQQQFYNGSSKAVVTGSKMEGSANINEPL